ncbi:MULTISPECIES: 2-keto-4-pentenoate hydratase [Bacillus]|uniref:2-keto-4-pentenoate hydratase n=1 Tax=Bacillus TaxID=1386 RepID=UPI00032D7FFF|nr:fumarylacetoacetate hydrolase family protein [Bacillus wiedmannii]EOP09344.1 2-oxopent-4-enoate hydratase [Bacillus cereus BAG2O-3]EOQ13945.1 2-oxopent-4-enoate hydratase [Bacillus cereus B5-2]EOQ33661.1 2-oxopent-4-enoate hydratase [Bacillus cereus BAG3O-1]MBJ8115539.1 fumarylacetoacetate hydrolase family protein [Bacillus cereus]RFB14265.1 2-keto-4-pentenoate hydratase [Bacillus sp. OE]RFB26894.1 2-keto-4-pentenoate hydratase [Bacillus sp. LB(2018)]RFB47805.1 2-keto-4-pentenoate hydrata
MLIRELADELVQAENSRVGILPFTERYDNLSVEDAYNIQLEVVGRKLESGRSIIGKKVGLTSVAMQQMLGVNEPDYGHLLDDMKIESGSEVSMRSFVSPKIEAEIGFVLEQDLNGPNITYIDVLMATKYVVPTLEIIDSRIVDWKIKLADTVADNGSSAKVVIGHTFSSIDKVDLRTTGMTLYKNNSLIATGAGAAALGHPAQAIAWLANKLYEFNIGLKAGELILPGALSGAVSVQSEDNIRADFGLLGSVSVTFI